MKICPLMSNSESSVYCTPGCNWFDPQKDGCIVFSIRQMMEDIMGDTTGIENNISLIESNIPQLYRG